MKPSELQYFAPVPPRPLVDRMRDAGPPICKEAADEIERLRRQRDELLSYLNGISRQALEMVKANS